MGEVHLAEDTKLERRVAALSGVAEARRIQAMSFQITAHITNHWT